MQRMNIAIKNSDFAEFADYFLNTYKRTDPYVQNQQKEKWIKSNKIN